MRRVKVYVDVNETHHVIQVGPDINDVELQIIPTEMIWVNEDESITYYEIECVKDVKRIASQAGGIGDRYTVKIQGRERYIWRERGTELWFVEKKVYPK